MALELCPVTTKSANDFVAKYHRHSGRTSMNGGKWAVGAYKDGEIVGVAIVGNPVARGLMDGWTAEVLRVCVLPDAPKNACSLLYGAAWRCWKAMGGRRMVTYTLQRENGASLRAVGWSQHKANSVPWHHAKRDRKHQDIYLEAKYRWEIGEKCDEAPPSLPVAPDQPPLMRFDDGAEPQPVGDMAFAVSRTGGSAALESGNV